VHPKTVYLLFYAFWAAGFGTTAATYVLCLLGHGFALSDIVALNVAFFLLTSIMEVPTGMLADGKSRVWSIRIGTLFFFAGALCYTTGTTFWRALLAESILAVGLAFISGALSSWLADALKKRGELHDLPNCLALQGALGALAAIAACMVGTFVGAGSLRTVWSVAAGFHACAAFVAWTCMGADVGEPAVGERLTERQALSASIAAVRASPGLGWALCIEACFGLVFLFGEFWTPFFRTRTSQESLPFIYMLLAGGIAAGSLSIRRFGAFASSDRRGVLVAIGCAGLGLAMIGLLPGLILPLGAVIVMQVGRGMYQPSIEAFVQHRLASGYRATFCSLQSLVARGGCGLIMCVSYFVTRGLPTNDTSIGRLWTLAGCTLLLVAFAAWRVRERAPNAVEASAE